MNWYLQSGKESDVAISTRIRFSRNINGYSFNGYTSYLFYAIG